MNRGRQPKTPHWSPLASVLAKVKEHVFVPDMGHCWRRSLHEKEKKDIYICHSKNEVLQSCAPYTVGEVKGANKTQSKSRLACALQSDACPLVQCVFNLVAEEKFVLESRFLCLLRKRSP